MYDRSAGANCLQLFRSVMIVTGHQWLQCITGLGKQPSYGTAITNDCTSETTVASHGHGGGGHCKTNVAAGNLRTFLMQGEAAHARPKAPGQEAEGAWECEKATFEAGYFDCKAENLRKP